LSERTFLVAALCRAFGRRVDGPDGQRRSSRQRVGGEEVADEERAIHGTSLQLLVDASQGPTSEPYAVATARENPVSRNDRHADHSRREVVAPDQTQARTVTPRNIGTRERPGRDRENDRT